MFNQFSSTTNTKQMVTNVTKNITNVKQSNEGAVITGGGGVAFVQANENSTTNIVQNAVKINK